MFYDRWLRAEKMTFSMFRSSFLFPEFWFLFLGRYFTEKSALREEQTAFETNQRPNKKRTPISFTVVKANYRLQKYEPLFLLEKKNRK